MVVWVRWGLVIGMLEFFVLFGVGFVFIFVLMLPDVLGNLVPPYQPDEEIRSGS